MNVHVHTHSHICMHIMYTAQTEYIKLKRHNLRTECHTCNTVNVLLMKTEIFWHMMMHQLVFFFFLKCDIPIVFYKFNMYSVQLTAKTQLIYCTVCTMYKNYMFRPILAIFRFFV